MTRECISRILELREILLSFQTGFNLVNAAVICAILESISDLFSKFPHVIESTVKIVIYSASRPLSLLRKQTITNNLLLFFFFLG